MKSGTYVFGGAAIAAGAINLAWGDFATNWQPVQALGDRIPGRELWAIVTAVWLIAGGAALFWPRTARAGAIALAVVYCIFAAFWLPRLYSAVHFLGFTVPVIVGVLDGVAEQAILAAAAVLLFARDGNAARTTAGLCALVFGINHFTGLSGVEAMIPAWLPAGATFWAMLTGSAFILAGISIAVGVRAAMAAQLLAAMFAVFSALIWIPQLFRYPHVHAAWGGNAFNLAVIGAVLIVARHAAAQPARARVEAAA